MKTVRISVRSLVEFILREGDIDNRSAGGLDKDVMLMGGRLHRKIQRSMVPEYHAEVSMKMLIPCGEFQIQIEGRADGIIIKEHKDKKGRGKNPDGEPDVAVDEIKGVLKELTHIERPVNVHLAQAKCYAYIYAEQHGLDRIGVQMTYCNLDTEDIRRFTEVYTRQELKEWFEDLVRQYEKWARFQIEWKKERDSSIRGLGFPFAYRAGQRDVAAAVYRTILRKKKLFIQAPTGVGKTISTVFPAVKAIGEGMAEKIFYLTAKTITRTVAEQAFRTLQDQGLRMKVITLTAKEKICFCEEAVCNPDACPYAKGHYDRVNDAVFDMIASGNEINRSAVEEQARKYKVCPFELSLDISTWTDAVICDYNYVFDPTAHLKRFFSEGSSGDYIFLIDEAHNLVERGREMYSASLYKEDLLEVKRAVRIDSPVLASKLESVNRLFLALKRECEDYTILDSVSHIALKLMNLLSEMENFLERLPDDDKREQVMALYFQIRSFVNIHDIMDENYVVYCELEKTGRFVIKLFCVNPAVNLQSYLEYGVSTVFFSATLLPIHYYKKLLSVETDDYAIYAETSFAKENRLLLMGTDVSTRYTMRSANMYERIARYIVSAAEGKKGNYMAFFPSYKVMREVYDCFREQAEEIESVIQSQNMSESEREEFLSLFEAEREKSLVGFCVMGGIFSEGIDLTEDRLIGAVIVGTGLPQVCNDREIVRKYFEQHGMPGFDYAYLFPGMNKVLQSAGRVIRTEKDRGMILLLDDRFQQRQYRETFPREWQGIRTCSADSLPGYLEEFWK
ncbi:MAG TPA: ATP-dependent DNA helicase [Candidatus Mediterraneibacter intestinipullorum]|nr:ATP-dependent DNA helicase [Candidatus Mediterraneibacter intestinipullorum]